jgi:capsular polysaccharide biosynthesis protein
MRETLEMAGIPPEKVVSCQDFPHIKAKEMVVPGPPHVSGNPQAWAMEYLRELLLPDFQSLPADWPRKLYISRSQAAVRNVTNEPEVRKMLEAQGFETIVMETLPVQQQIALFAGAEVIVAPHGAGLTHLVFARQGTKVIELFSPLYVNACFYALASLMRLDYHYLIGQGKRPPEGTDPEINVSDITVKLDELTAMLQQAGVQPSPSLS